MSLEERLVESLAKSEWIFCVDGDEPTAKLIWRGSAKTHEVVKASFRLCGSPWRRIRPIIQTIMSRVQDEQQCHLELHCYLNPERGGWRGSLPLDDEASYKLAVIFELAKNLKDCDRCELIARRVERMTREEAGYWYSRMNEFGTISNRWAVQGLRIMLSGRSHSSSTTKLLTQIRDKSV